MDCRRKFLTLLLAAMTALPGGCLWQGSRSFENCAPPGRAPTSETAIVPSVHERLAPDSFATACCGIELMATASSRYDLARFGAEVFRFSPRQADLLIVAGRVAVMNRGEIVGIAGVDGGAVWSEVEVVVLTCSECGQEAEHGQAEVASDVRHERSPG